MKYISVLILYFKINSAIGIILIDKTWNKPSLSMPNCYEVVTAVSPSGNYQDNKVHGANMGPTWVLSAPDGPHVRPMNLVIRVWLHRCEVTHWNKQSYCVTTDVSVSLPLTCVLLLLDLSPVHFTRVVCTPLKSIIYAGARARNSDHIHVLQQTCKSILNISWGKLIRHWNNEARYMLPSIYIRN